jgi:hypothetical protein
MALGLACDSEGTAIARSGDATCRARTKSWARCVCNPVAGQPSSLADTRWDYLGHCRPPGKLAVRKVGEFNEEMNGRSHPKQPLRKKPFLPHCASLLVGRGMDKLPWNEGVAE